ncbi:uncharacterized protein ACNLHF_016203 [Anomaloglossus baeobatrachus]|uniref:uncharacterized protein LOC142302168 n=1 Tax=Anomaloglossus baeobatrachus TaxID=238106 RepID=UPI003F50820F
MDPPDKRSVDTPLKEKTIEDHWSGNLIPMDPPDKRSVDTPLKEKTIEDHWSGLHINYMPCNKDNELQTNISALQVGFGGSLAPNPGLTMPCTEDYPGPHGLQLEFPQTETTKSVTSWYSPVLNKLFCQLMETCLILIRVKNPLPLRSILRIAAVYKISSHEAEVVRYCPYHERSTEAGDDSAPRSHLIQVEGNSQASYTEDSSGHHNVCIPYEEPQAGSETTVLLLKYMCSCFKGITDHRLMTVITLESEEGLLLGQRSFEVEICTDPKMNCRAEEELFGLQKHKASSSWSEGTDEYKPIFMPLSIRPAVLKKRNKSSGFLTPSSGLNASSPWSEETYEDNPFLIPSSGTSALQKTRSKSTDDESSGFLSRFFEYLKSKFKEDPMKGQKIDQPSPASSELTSQGYTNWEVVEPCTSWSLEEFEDEEGPPPIQTPAHLDATTMGIGETSQENKEPVMSDMKMTVDNFTCRFCGKAQDSAALVCPTGSLYRFFRLKLNSPGLYRCDKTGIKFRVKSAVIIEYKLDSWIEHLNDIQNNIYEILGPLFNINAIGEPNAVSAVYLPHYLCLKDLGEDAALVKCAHFKDGNLMLESPTQIDPFYIMLENPTFSFLGALKLFGNKKVAIHGIVLIYVTILCKDDPLEEFRIHLYVLPHTMNAEEILDNQNNKIGYLRIIKPEQTTDKVYKEIKYFVRGQPSLEARPKSVKFQSERYHYTEIHMKEKHDEIYLSLSEENSEDPIWDAQLTKSDIKNITQLLSHITLHEGDYGPLQDSSHHFLDTHRTDLINQIIMVDPVLDDLLGQAIITYGQYHIIRCIETTQSQMRQLCDFVSCFQPTDKDKVITALRKHNPSAKIWKLRSLQTPNTMTQ